MDQEKPPPPYMAMLSLYSWPAFWRPAGPRLTCEAIEVRRGVYLLLAVFRVQLSGRRALLLAEPALDARVLPPLSPLSSSCHGGCKLPTK